MPMKNPPKIVWGNQVNLGGLLYPTPIRYHHKPWQSSGKPRVDEWWTDCGNFHIEKLGVDTRPNIIRFASTSKSEAKVWTQGVQAVLTLLHSIFYQNDVLLKDMADGEEDEDED